MTRLDYWKNQQFHYAISIDADSSLAQLAATAKKRPIEEQLLPTHLLIGSSRELIMQWADEKPLFWLVMPHLDHEYFDVSVYPSFTMQGESEEDAKEILAIAMAHEVDVYPDDEDAARELARLLEELMTSGFLIEDPSGKKYNVKLAQKRAIRIGNENPWDGYSPMASISPAEILAIREHQKLVDDQVIRAARVLANLRLGIERFRMALESDTRNESELQECLTTFPTLFGLEYAHLHEKYPLGKEYVTDYALERHSGRIDLVEIESSSLRLYNKNGNPSADLVHAEQQILDWLAWIDRTGTYSRIDLPGLVSPTAFIVFGSRKSMSPRAIEALERRNLAWRGTLHIFTYEDLLKRADGMLQLLVETRAVESPGADAGTRS